LFAKQTKNRSSDGVWGSGRFPQEEIFHYEECGACSFMSFLSYENKIIRKGMRTVNPKTIAPMIANIIIIIWLIL
jgi:hypothetical protein